MTYGIESISIQCLVCWSHAVFTLFRNYNNPNILYFVNISYLNENDPQSAKPCREDECQEIADTRLVNETQWGLKSLQSSWDLSSGDYDSLKNDVATWPLCHGSVWPGLDSKAWLRQVKIKVEFDLWPETDKRNKVRPRKGKGNIFR